MAEQNLILDLTFKFALDSITFSELLEEKRKFNMARQYWRSSTSIGASVRESQGAESKSDFCHKLKIAYKEAEESEYWLLLCKNSSSYPHSDELLQQVLVIKKVLGKIIGNTKIKHRVVKCAHLHICKFAHFNHLHICKFSHLHI